MAWVLGPDCEALCLFLEIDSAAIRERAAALYREFLAREEAIPLSRSTQTAIQKNRQEAPETSEAWFPTTPAMKVQ
ncbi:hypothetical protein AGMMS49944_13980 [Spirochaetia bacterium]|nr:hypothetical protein AGMMS49944_13980 [Spirochaetia bacterium]